MQNSQEVGAESGEERVRERFQKSNIHVSMFSTQFASEKFISQKFLISSEKRLLPQLFSFAFLCFSDEESLPCYDSCCL